MIRKWLLKIFINLYLKKNRDIYKLTPKNELKKFMFSNTTDVFDIMRAFLTSQTLSYWEANSDYERNIVKGSGLMLQLLMDLNRASLKINENYKDEDRRLKEWLRIKNNLLAEKTNQKTQ